MPKMQLQDLPRDIDRDPLRKFLDDTLKPTDASLIAPYMDSGPQSIFRVSEFRSFGWVRFYLLEFLIFGVPIFRSFGWVRVSEFRSSEFRSFYLSEFRGFGVSGFRARVSEFRCLSAL